MKNLTVKLSLLLFTFSSSFAQKYHFRKYGLEEGLPQTTLTALTQDSRGFLWIGTQGGASRFDGKNFVDFTTKEGIINNRINDIIEDKYGNIWFATNAGITIYTAGEVIGKYIHVTQKNDLKNEMIFALTPDGKDGIFIGSRDGIYYYGFKQSENPFNNENDSLSVENVSNIDLSNSPVIRAVFIDSKKRIWIGTGNGLICYYPYNGRQRYISSADNLSGETINTIAEDSEGNIWCGTLGGVSRIVLDNDTIAAIVNMKNLGTLGFSNVPAIYCNPDSTVWVSTPMVVLFEKDTKNPFGYSAKEIFSKVKGLQANAIIKIICDREGNYWFGGAEHGLAMLSDRKFELYNNDFLKTGNSVRAISEDKNGNYWVGTNDFVDMIPNIFDKTNITHGYAFIEPLERKKGLTVNSIWSLLHDSKGNLWIGASNGVCRFDGKSSEVFSDRKGFTGKTVMRLYEDRKGQVWFGTFSGVNIYDPETQKIYSPFKQGDLLHNQQVFAFHEDTGNVFWFGSRLGLTKYANGNFIQYEIKDGLPNNSVNIICPDKHGNLWLATGHGISRFDGRHFNNYSTYHGISSDTPYLLLLDDDGNLWVGTNKGLDKLILNAMSEITDIVHYGKAEGFLGVETNSNAALKDTKGYLWFGTMEGVVKYNKRLDKINMIEPLVSFTGMEINYKKTPMFKDMILDYSQNHITFYYSGLSLTIPEKVRYKYMVEGFDKEWSPETKETFCTYSNLPHGNYAFKVIACNNDKIWNSNPATYYFIIMPPFWKTNWFYFLCIVLLIVSIYGYIRIKTQTLRRTKEILRAKVAERTRELFDKNTEITDSINYAKRIQDSIFSEQNDLKILLPESFILFKPCQIVSGDFHWFTRKDNKIIIAAVDCTGHGVPGAFMSMLGNAFLNDIVNDKGVTYPGDVLDTLREQVIKSLKQSSGANKSKDGMDIALISLDMIAIEKQLSFAGANNPLYVIRKGENTITEFKGDKQPVSYYDLMLPFTNQTVQIQSGDIFYIFSDGYEDQFGGPKGKKFKAAKMKELLLSVHKKPMHEQKDILDKKFEEWKGSIEQVDDVLVIGVMV